MHVRVVCSQVGLHDDVRVRVTCIVWCRNIFMF